MEYSFARSGFRKGRAYSNALMLLNVAQRKPKFLARLAGGWFRAVILRQQRLRFMDVAIDYACNMKCSHCSAVSLGRKKEQKLTLNDYASLADQLCNEGCLIFHFTGGEPLLRSDLEDIIRACKPECCGISIQSNGILADRKRLKSLREAGADIFCVSIDSGIPREHDEFRNYPGAYDLAVEALDNAVELGYQTMISTCLSHENIGSEGFLKAVALAEERGIWCSINLAAPAGNWRECDKFLLTEDDQRKWREFALHHPLYHIDLQHNWKNVGCGTIKEKLYLTAYGEIMPCPFIQVSLGDIRTESMRTIRERALRYPKFAEYYPKCLAAEDRYFIENNPCYRHCDKIALPVPWKDVPELAKYMAGSEAEPE